VLFFCSSCCSLLASGAERFFACVACRWRSGLVARFKTSRRECSELPRVPLPNDHPTLRSRSVSRSTHSGCLQTDVLNMKREDDDKKKKLNEAVRRNKRYLKPLEVLSPDLPWFRRFAALWFC
jgi:hypothetical protein